MRIRSLLQPMRSLVTTHTAHFPTSALGVCPPRSFITVGIDAFRKLLRDHRAGVSASGNDGAETAPESSQRNGQAGNLFPYNQGAHDVDLMVKDLLRIFTRKVPGGLVPDGLVRGFMQAYTELRGPDERLEFFRVITSEMGLSVSEVNTAVRLWDAAVSRPPDSAAAVVAAAAAPSGAIADGPPPTLPSDAAAAASSPPPPPLQWEAVYRAADRIFGACTPLYTQLFLPLSQLPNGMKFLVDLRADVMAAAEQLQAAGAPSSETAPLRAMGDHLRHYLAEWFSVGLLQLQPISWNESPAALLERVMLCEAVHPVGSWEDLRRRLGPRRCVFAFTHPSMPGEPLVVLHTALLGGPASSMSEILVRDEVQQSPSSPSSSPSSGASTAAPPPPPAAPPAPTLPPPTTAVFYSISASQPGLKGIELGHFLIEKVAERLMAENPTLRQLVTLSPLPNFRSWLTTQLRREQLQAAQAAAEMTGAGGATTAGGGSAAGAGGGGGGGVEPLLRDGERQAVVRLAAARGWDGAAAGSSVHAAAGAIALSWLLEDDRWLQSAAAGTTDATGTSSNGSGHSDDIAGGSAEAVAASAAAAATAVRVPDDADAVLRPLLLRLASHYLAREKRRLFALCPVAHFHLRNGASLWRLNWRADTSARGLHRSLGIMVNYEYQMNTLYDNNRKYLVEHKVELNPQVAALLRE